MHYVVFDVETQDTFEEVGKNDPAALSVSVACAYDSETKSYTVVTHDKLDELWPLFERADAIVGYNSNHFDIPLLNKYYPGDLTHIKSIDILEDIRMSLGKRLKLDSVAEATLGTGKSGHGLQAIMWWRQGEIEKIKEYCQKDVEITKRIFEYALKHQFLKYKDGPTSRKIPLDTSRWNSEGENHALTHSLPF